MDTAVRSNRVNWLYFLSNGTDKDDIFLYGLSLPTSFSEQRNSKPLSICTLGHKRVLLYYSIKDIDINGIQGNNTLDLSKINSNIHNKLYYYETEHLIQVPSKCYPLIPESPIGSTVNIDAYYSSDFEKYIQMPFDERYRNELHGILSALQKDSGQSFTGPYCKRLGCFEYGHVKDWAEAPSPFSIEKDDDLPGAYVFKRVHDDEDVFVHLIVYSRSNEILHDLFKPVNKGSKEIKLTPEPKGDSSFEYWVFNDRGDLLHRDREQWLLETYYTINIQRDRVKIMDKASSRDDAAKRVALYTPTGAQIRFIRQSRTWPDGWRGF